MICTDKAALNHECPMRMTKCLAIDCAVWILLASKWYCKHCKTTYDIEDLKYINPPICNNQDCQKGGEDYDLEIALFGLFGLSRQDEESLIRRFQKISLNNRRTSNG